METSFQPTTFVPKRPIIPNEGGIRPKHRMSFFKLFSVIVFLFALALSGGLFVYKITLAKSNESKKVKIEEAIKNFEPDLTRQLTILKGRLDAAKNLLQSHIAFSAFLALLESSTAQTVRYSDFTYQANSGQDVSVMMKGESGSYAAIAFQSDTLSRNEKFKSIVFSDLNINEKGIITFSVLADVDPESIAYKKGIVKNAGAALGQPIPMSATTTPPGTSTSTATTTPSPNPPQP